MIVIITIFKNIQIFFLYAEFYLKLQKITVVHYRLNFNFIPKYKMIIPLTKWQRKD